MMNSYESMKSKLESTGIYKVSNESNIKKELLIYSQELDRIFEKLSELERECFIETAQDYGLTEREKIFGVDRSSMTVQERRELLKSAEQLEGDSTPKGFEKILKGYGLKDFSLVEHIANNYLIINISDKLSDSQKLIINKRVKEDFPLHLTSTVYYL